MAVIYVLSSITSSFPISISKVEDLGFANQAFQIFVTRILCRILNNLRSVENLSNLTLVRTNFSLPLIPEEL